MEGTTKFINLYTLSSDSNYLEVPFVAKTEVLVNHSFGVYPAVQVVDSGFNDIICEIIHDSINTLRVVFTTAQTGKVILN